MTATATMTCVQESIKPNLDLNRENRQVGKMPPNRLTNGTLKIGPDNPFPDLLLTERFYRTLPATGFLA